MRSMLEVGVILPGRAIPRWQRRLLEQLLAADFVRTSIVYVANGHAKNGAIDPMALLFRGYETLDRLLMSRMRSPETDAMDSVPVDDLIANAGSGDRLDVILQLDDRAIVPSPAPRHGVWRYRYDEFSAFARGELVTRQQ